MAWPPQISRRVQFHILLGRNVRGGPRAVARSLGVEKASAWVHELRLILDPGSICRAAASKLAGRLRVRERSAASG
eukprot:8920630-Pyramimonas_sp.AAC.1